MNQILKINGKIEREAGINIAAQIVMANRSPEVEKIILAIDSGGGNIDVIVTIWETIKMSDKPVICIGTACVASTAAAIFMMGSRRILLPHTEFLLHKSSIGLKGDFNPDEIEEIKHQSYTSTELLLAPILENSKLSKQVLYKKIKGCDWFLSEDEMIKYGIVTETYNREEVKKLLF